MQPRAAGRHLRSGRGRSHALGAGSLTDHAVLSVGAGPFADHAVLLVVTTPSLTLGRGHSCGARWLRRCAAMLRPASDDPRQGPPRPLLPRVALSDPAPSPLSDRAIERHSEAATRNESTQPTAAEDHAVECRSERRGPRSESSQPTPAKDHAVDCRSEGRGPRSESSEGGTRRQSRNARSQRAP